MSKNFKILRGPSKEEQDKAFENFSSNEMLLKAAQYGSLKWIKKALNRGANIHYGQDNSLIWAAYNGHLEIVKLLLNKGANIHARNNEALKWAEFNGRQDVTNLLKQHIKNEKIFNNS